jgi:hypothetical protein
VRLDEASDALPHRICLQVDHFHGVIGACGNEQKTVCGVDGQVVELAGNSGEDDCL